MGVGSGAEAAPANPRPEVRPGSVFGVLATSEELVITCNRQLFSRIAYLKLLAAGERVAVFVEQGAGSEVRINVGQKPFLHLPDNIPAAVTGDSERSPANSGANIDSSVPMSAPAPTPWGRA